MKSFIDDSMPTTSQQWYAPVSIDTHSHVLKILPTSDADGQLHVGGMLGGVSGQQLHCVPILPQRDSTRQ